MSIQVARSPVEIFAWQRQVTADARLSHADLRVAIRLSLFVNSKSGKAWPSLSTLCQASQTSRSSVKRAIRLLKELGLVLVSRGSCRTSNTYQMVLNPPPVPVSAPRDKEDAPMAAGVSMSSASLVMEFSLAAVEMKPVAVPSAQGIAETPRAQPVVELKPVTAPSAQGIAETPRLPPAPSAAPAPQPQTLAAMPRPRPTQLPASAYHPHPRECTDEEITHVIEHLNHKANACLLSFPGTDSYRIVRRVLQQYTPDILCGVIDLKVRQWFETPYRRYLQPGTLFAPNKLERYVSELYQQRAPRPKPPEPPTYDLRYYTKEGVSRAYLKAVEISLAEQVAKAEERRRLKTASGGAPA